uniref:AIPP2-like SPOC-like domain-containing protein n=1 Tax=Oryza punctata TaxID=4537 RepID=A0A0E0MCR5_ORYPU
MGRKEDRRRDIGFAGFLRRFRGLMRGVSEGAGKMNVLCEVCGDVGWEELILRCNKCKNAARHHGIMKIGMDYIPVGAHLSNKACKKVCELSMSLPQIMKVTEIPISKAWPKSWEEASVPTAESIGLFFFSQNTRSNKEFDDLVKHVIDCDIVLETDVSFAKLLVFPSVVLPAEYRVFQGKHYLWGVFKRSKDMAERDALVEQNCTGCLADEDVPEQNALDIVPSEALDQEMALVVSDIHHHNQLSLTASQEVEKEALSDKGPSPPVINSPEKPMYLILDTSCKVLKKWRCKRMRTKSSVL